MSANPETISSATALCVDDEPNILSRSTAVPPRRLPHLHRRKRRQKSGGDST